MVVSKKVKPLVIAITLTLFLTSCKEQSRSLNSSGSKSQTNGADQARILASVKSQQTTYTLKRTNGWRAVPEHLVLYKGDQKNKYISFYCSDTYGVLEYSDATDEWPRSFYYVYPVPNDLKEEITLNLEEALFKITEEAFQLDMSSFSDLVGDFLVVGEPGDHGEFISIIDLKSRNLVGQLIATSKGLTSFDGTTAVYWEFSEKALDKDSICPEHKGTDLYQNYQPTEEIQFNVKTQKRIETNTYDCGFMQ